MSGPASMCLTTFAVSARPDGSCGGGTSFTEAGLKATWPAARRWSKKERTTESLKATVAGLRPRGELAAPAQHVGGHDTRRVCAADGGEELSEDAAVCAPGFL